MKCHSCGYDNRDDALMCDMCKAVFRKAPRATPPPAAVAQKETPLKINYPAIAEQMVAHTNDPYLGGFGILLDYSPASLLGLDAFITELYGTEGEAPDKEEYQPSKGKQQMIMTFGSYFGETLRRMFRGRWQEDPKNQNNPLWTSVAFGEGDDVLHVFPIARLFKRFKNGSADDLMSLFAALRSRFAPNGLPDEAESFFRQGERFAACGEGHVGSKYAARCYEYAIKLDPSLASRPRTAPPPKAAPPATPEPKPRDPSLVLANPPLPHRAATPEGLRAAGGLFDRAGYAKVAKMFFDRASSSH